MNEFYPFITSGDVIVSPGSDRRFKVLKVNSANYRCVAEDGSEWNVRRTQNVVRADDQTWGGPEPEHFVVGTVVRFKDAKSAARYPGKYVVIHHSGPNCRFAKLGGDNDRYISGSALGVERVEVDPN